MPQQWGFQEKQMAYSFMTAISDGTLRVMPITFPYMKVEDINVRQNITLLKAGRDYDINNNVITFRYNIPKGDRIAVDRMSQKASLRVNFLEGATFSRENMDDVLTQLLYLTQEAIEGSVDRVSPTGVLDLNGNRIINLGDPIDLQDAVPLHLVVDAEKSVYASEAKCKQYRDEALGYKNEAFTYADRAYASELNAKKSEDNAKASEINAANSASSILGAVEQSAESAAAAKVSETNAKASENKTEAMVDRVEDALAAVEGYGDRLDSVEGDVSTCISSISKYDIGFANVGEDGKQTVTIKIPYDAGKTVSASFKVSMFSGWGSVVVIGCTTFSVSLVSQPNNNNLLRFNVTRDTNPTGSKNWWSIGNARRTPEGLFFDVHSDFPNKNTVMFSLFDEIGTAGVDIPSVLANATVSSAFAGEAFNNDCVYSTKFPPPLPSPSAIGAVASSNVVGTLAEGALFEKYYTPNGWTVIKRIDGTMEMWAVSNTVLGSGSQGNLFFRAYGSLKYPEPFKSLPSITYRITTEPSSPIWIIHRNGTSVGDTGTHQAWSPFDMGQDHLPILVRAVGEWKNISSITTLEEPEVEEGIANTLEEPPVLNTPQVLPYDPEI